MIRAWETRGSCHESPGGRVLSGAQSPLWGPRPPGRQSVSSPLAAGGSACGFIWGIVSGSFKPNFSFSGTCCISAEYSHRSHPPRGPHTASFFPESSKFLVPASAAACVYTRVTFTSSDMVWISPPALRGGCLSAPPVTHHAQAAEATKRNRMTLRC